MSMMKQAETPMPHCNKSNVALMQMTVAGKDLLRYPDCITVMQFCQE
jgi:hypothetical protein